MALRVLLVLPLVLMTATSGCSGQPGAQPDPAARSSSPSPTAAPVERPDMGAGEPATVLHVIDGDTLDALVAGTETRIRILNIDTPETDPDVGVECLGEEATRLARALLPEGSSIELHYDRQRTDRYGRTLAAVETTNGRLVAEELAAAGLARPVVFDGNDRYLAAVEEAAAEAQSAQAGLWDPRLEC